MTDVRRTGNSVEILPPPAIMRVGGDPLGLAKLRVAAPGNAEIDLPEIIAMQSAYIGELRAKAEAQETTAATLAGALQAFVWYAERGEIPPRSRSGRFIVPKALVDQLWGGTITIGANAHGDMLVQPIERGARNPVWDSDAGA